MGVTHGGRSSASSVAVSSVVSHCYSETGARWEARVGQGGKVAKCTKSVAGGCFRSWDTEVGGETPRGQEGTWLGRERSMRCGRQCAEVRH